MENKKQILIDNNKLLKLLKNLQMKDCAVVRKGDGENVLIGFNKIKGISINKYLKKLKHFNIRKLDFKFQNFFKKLIESFMNADYLGIAKDYSYSSIRKFDNEITKYYKLDVKNLIDSHFHLEFVKNPNNNQLMNILLKIQFQIKN